VVVEGGVSSGRIVGRRGVPRGDLEGCTEDLGSNEFGHDEVVCGDVVNVLTTDRTGCVRCAISRDGRKFVKVEVVVVVVVAVGLENKVGLSSGEPDKLKFRGLSRKW